MDKVTKSKVREFAYHAFQRGDVNGDGQVNFQDMAAAAGRSRDWVEQNITHIERAYKSRVRVEKFKSIPIIGWVLSSVWRVIIMVMAILFVLLWIFAPRPALPTLPMTQISAMQKDLAKISAGMDVLTHQVEAVDTKVDAMASLVDKVKTATPRQRRSWGQSFFGGQ